MKRIRVIYLTWGETPRSFGVFGSQVIEQFVHIQKVTDGDFYFISAVPILNSSLVNEQFGYRKELKEVKNKLGKISFHWLNIWCSQNFVYSNRFSFFLMHGISHIFLANKIVKLNPDIVHCRSLHAAYAAIKVKQKNNLTFKVIFDIRSPFPEAIMLKKNYGIQNKSYIFLKSIEALVFKNSDSIVAVSDTMKTYYEQEYRRHIELIYLSTDTEKLKITTFQDKDVESINFVYVGALTEKGWHQIGNLVELFRKLVDCFKYATLKIVTNSNHIHIKKYFNEFSDGKISIVSTKNIDELKQELSNSDIACLSYFNPESYGEKILSESVLAVKTVEYLSAGLPIICNKNCGGAVKILDEYKIGISYDPNTLTEVNKDSIMKLLDKNVKIKAMNIAKKLFDYESNAMLYKEIYDTLLHNN